jgi:heterodisulfide reductase subunit B2
MKKYALFLGCTIPARSRNYELSARNVAEKVGIELVDLEESICCGFPMKAIDERSAQVMAAYNLSLVEEKGLGLCTLCSSCASALTETAYRISGDGQRREEINRRLSRVHRSYMGEVRVKHLARILYEEVGASRIEPLVTKKLTGLKIAIHYGCHYLKPSKVYGGFDDPEDAKSLDRLVQLTGAEVVEYPGKKRCCGGPVLPMDEKVALAVAKEKLDEVLAVGADLLCLICPFCAVMYDSNQKTIESRFGVSYNLPVLYLTQVLGLAMGIDPKALGLSMNVVKTKELVARIVG